MLTSDIMTFVLAWLLVLCYLFIFILFLHLFMDVVVVTGFWPYLPYGINPKNASWEVVKLLPKIIENVKIVIEKIPFIYDDVDRLVPQLWGKYSPRLVVHIGVSEGSTEITLESQAVRGEYQEFDCAGRRHPRWYVCGNEDRQPCLKGTLGVKANCHCVDCAAEECPTGYVCGKEDVQDCLKGVDLVKTRCDFNDKICHHCVGKKRPEGNLYDCIKGTLDVNSICDFINRNCKIKACVSANAGRYKICHHCVGKKRPEGNLYDCIKGTLDVNSICDFINRNCKIKACVSANAGRSVPEFLYYSSLKIDKNRTMFIHIPPIDQPYSDAELAAGITEVINCALKRCPSKKLYVGQVHSCPHVDCAPASLEVILPYVVHM